MENGLSAQSHPDAARRVKSNHKNAKKKLPKARVIGATETHIQHIHTLAHETIIKMC